MDLVRATIERYVSLTDDDWGRIGPHWKRYAFKKGRFVSEPGRIEQRFYIVEHGVQRLYVHHEGLEVCLGFSYDGSWSGDYDSFLNRRAGRFAVQALTDSVLWGIDFDELQALYANLPIMERFGRRILEELFTGRATREIELLTKSAEQRYTALLQRSPQLLQLVPQKDIASYLHMKPETFSRLRARAMSVRAKSPSTAKRAS
jgi:CRP-like cAMP-binding protein